MKESAGVVAVKGGYGYGNFGDDAMMLVVYAVVSEAFPSSKIVFICKDAAYIKRFIPGSSILECKNVNDIDCRFLIYGGGTQFYSFPRTTRSWAFRILRKARNPLQIAREFVLMLAKAVVPSPAREVFGLGIGAGPFIENHTSIKETRRLLRNMSYISVRDISSYNFCRDSGCRNVTLRSDLCYLPGFWESLGIRPTSSNHRAIQKIGIIVRDWPHTIHGDSYATPALEVATRLRNEGKEVTFILFSKSDRAWRKRLSESNTIPITWDPDKQTVADFLKSLLEFDLFITARYHGAVFASILCKPIVCIEVEQKLRLVSKLIGEGSRLWSYPFQASDCLSMISDIEREYVKAVKALMLSVGVQNNLATRMINEFRIAAINRQEM